MRLMLIGTDRTLFRADSTVRRRITLLGSTYTEALDTIVFSTRTHGISCPQALAPNVHAYSTNSLSRFLYSWNAYRIAKRLPRPDIISAQDPFETGLTALLIARYWRVPFAVEIHTDFFSPSFAEHSLLNRLRVLLSKFVLTYAAGGYAVSAKIKQKVGKRHTRLPLSVLPIYVNVDRFAKIVHREHPHFKTALLWVGRMEKEKDPTHALQAFIVARKKGFDVGLTFVGTGRLIELLKSEACRAGVAEWVEFVGFQSDLRPHYACADLLLVTSRYEGYGMVIIEALAAGVQVLSTDVGIASEVGAIVAEYDYDSALCDWLSGPRTPGVLKCYPYANEEEYFFSMQAFYKSLAQDTPASV